MITAGVIIAHDEEFGYNAGVYRLLVKDRNTTGIDIVTPKQVATSKGRFFLVSNTGTNSRQ